MRPGQRELDPITLLQEMERVILSREKELLKDSDRTKSGLWYGIGYLINDVRFVSPLKHVREVLLHSKVVVVPETHAWMKGLANSRGQLITVVDVAEFLDWPTSDRTDKGRWMLINDTRLNCAIVVQEVVGLKQFSDGQVDSQKKVPSAQVGPFLTGKVFQGQAHKWYELDLLKLSKHKNFVSASIQAD